MKIEGPLPGPRSFHTLTTVGNKAVLFGGRGRDNKHFDAFEIFDIGRFNCFSFLCENLSFDYQALFVLLSSQNKELWYELIVSSFQ